MVRAEFYEQMGRLGWTYVERPAIDAVAGLNCPPFGQGYRRTVLDQIVGKTRLGVPFQAVRYATDAGGDPYGRVVALRLDHPMPPLFVSLPDHPRPGIVGLRIPNQTGLLVVSPDAEFADAVLEVAQPLLVRWAKRYPINLSIDGDSLVGTGAPVDPDGLLEHLEALDDIAAALSHAPSLDRFTIAKPSGLSFYQRPAWVYRPRDDSIMAGAEIARSGYDHEAVDVVDIPERGLWFTGFTHRYKTQQSSGKSTSTQQHDDPVGQMLLPFRFGSFANRWKGYGDPLAFFGSLDDYAFSSPDAMFATTIVRSMTDFLSAAAMPPFAIVLDRIHIRPASNSPEEYERLAWTFAEFLSLVPDVIWRGTGLATSPVPRSLR
jgi:hypothetical protein